MARTLLAAVALTLVSFTSVAQAQIQFGGGFNTPGGRVNLNTQIDPLGVTRTQTFTGRNLQTQAVQANGVFGQVRSNAVNVNNGQFQTQTVQGSGALGQFNAQTNAINNGQFQTRSFNASGALGSMQANRVQANGFSYTQGTINGPQGGTTQIQQIGGANGKLNLIQHTDANGRTRSLLLPSR